MASTERTADVSTKQLLTDVELPERRVWSPRAVRLMSALTSLGPAFLVYGLLIDHVPDGWFTVGWLRFLFSATVAGLAGLSWWLVLARRTLSRSSVEVPMVATEPTPSVAEILSGTREAIVADMRGHEEEGQLQLGWSQYFDSSIPPTAIGTSYGLRLVNLLNVQDARVDRARILGTLKALQEPGGGWCASSQRDVARPEPTAWVLAAAVRAGLDVETRTVVTTLLDGMLDPIADPVGAGRVSVVTSVISTLAETVPDSPQLAALVRRLAGSANQMDERAGTVAWGTMLDRGVRGSVPHTARAVCALAKVLASTTTPSPEYGRLVRKAVTWLRQDDNMPAFAERLRNTEEQVRRPAPGHREDVLVIGHFTAVWVARALIAAGVPADDEHLRTAVGIVCRQQEKGVWEWDEGQKPLWMTYQGALVLQEYSQRCLPWPP